MLGVTPCDARGYMIRGERWKYIHFRDFPPQLFDLQNDPDEFHDLGRTPEHADIRRDMQNRLFERLSRRKNRVTATDDMEFGKRKEEAQHGIIVGES